jgi:hypothetical protein
VSIPPNQNATGDIDSMVLPAGQSVGLVAEIKPLARSFAKSCVELGS